MIPTTAVEAAAKAAHLSKLTGVQWEDLPNWKKRDRLNEARAALKAAAPHMRDAWESEH